MQRIVNLFILSSVLLSACGQSVGQHQPRPASTDAVLDYQRYCHYWYWEYIYRSEVDFNRCLSEGIDVTLCQDLYTERTEENEGNWYACLDDLPMVSQDCRMQLDHANPDQDTDGDGISDYMESWMSLNPCERCSYGGTEGVNCDADLDFDADGIPNGEDHDPGCSSGVPGFEGCLF